MTRYVKGLHCPVTDKVCHSAADAKATVKAFGHKVARNVFSRYECPHWRKHPPGAGKWHVGHTPARKRRRRRGR